MIQMDNLLQLLFLFIQIHVSIQTEIANCDSRTCLPSSCADIFVSGNTRSGVYIVYPKKWFDKSNITVYCDMETDGGGWTVFQRRGKYEVQQSFIQNWNAYRKGFGYLERDFWLGNDNIHILTNQEYVSLRIDLETFDGATAFALYNQFRISGCHDKYRLHLDKFSGTTVDNMAYHNHATFATFDKDDVHNCSAIWKGGWWYNECHMANLNGLYEEGSAYHQTVIWKKFSPTCLKKTEMKIRPAYFSTREN